MMIKANLVVIGAQAAGMSAASRAKRKKPEMDILVLEKGDHVSYGACGLPYFVADLVKEMEGLVVHSALFFKEKRGIPILTRHECIAIHPVEKTVVARSLDSGEEVTIQYDGLVIGTGNEPTWPEALSGRELQGAFTLKTIEDGMKIKSYIEELTPKSAVIIGAGIIGLEMAEALSVRGMAVTILKRPGSILRMLDDAMTLLVEEELAKHGVVLIKNAEITSINGENGVVKSVTSNQTEYPADLVLVAAGATPRSALAQASGLAIGSFGEIVVDDRMMTSDPFIYACGDCVGQIHRVSGQPVYQPRGTTANKQGRIAGENAAGGDDRFPGILGTAVCKIFDLEVACTGLNETTAKHAGFDAAVSDISHPSHAHTYPHPHPEPIHIRLVLEKGSGRLLGAQMVGKIGVAKRIDVFATAIYNEMTVQEIGNLDLSYSPPFAPVWDAVLVAANAAVKKI
jgi:NADPH-dependent 2,4-dienoyl-CoA reductase/sulfur reductase-like enzyme